MMTLWCMMRSPLMIGGDLPQNDDFTLKLLTNADLLEIEKTTWCAHPLTTTDEESVWVAPRQDGKGYYVAAFNLSDESRTVTASPEAPAKGAKELWSGKQTEVLSAEIPPHDAMVWKVEL